MSGQIKFCMDKATVAEIAEHLSQCDADFVPPLGTRVEINAYAKKIADKAKRFEASLDGVLIGLVAAYCTDIERGAAFITSVSILPAWQGLGVASQLMQQCIGHANDLGFNRIELKVDSRNMDAIKLYGKHGFIIDGLNGPETSMHLNLGKVK